LRECSTDVAPWFVIPSNHKWFRNLAVSQILVEYLEALKMEFPKPTVNLKKIRRQYQHAEKECTSIAKKTDGFAKFSLAHVAAGRRCDSATAFASAMLPCIARH
jgi:hypothetical protein